MKKSFIILFVAFFGALSLMRLCAQLAADGEAASVEDDVVHLSSCDY